MTAGAQRFRPIRTYNESWLQRHRDTHSRHAEFGTHRHPYLHELMKQLATELTVGERPTLLDYGCGKGAFLQEMTRSGRFRFIRGYDPAVAAFKSRPSQLYDLVACLDVLDQAEHEFVEPIIEDVAQFTGRFAVFDVITVQTPRLAHLNPRSAEAWKEIISRHMNIDQMIVRAATAQELQEGACPERAIFVTTPHADHQRPSSRRATPDAKASKETFSVAHIGRQQEAHAAADGYGRHRHLYLHDTMQRIAVDLGRAQGAEDLSWLDYGCGKGGFIEEMRPLGVFKTIRGYDPAVAAFAARPEGSFDLVTCFDVLDVVEAQFLDNILDDIAILTKRLALFSCLCRPNPSSKLSPHPPFYWSSLIGRHMKIVATQIEYPGMDSFERVIIQATP